MSLCIWLLNKINMAYNHIDLDRGVVVPMIASDVGLVFGLPHTRRTLSFPRGKNNYERVLSINEIQVQMAKSENGDDFK